MTYLIKLTDLVYEILSDYEKARNSDNFLYYKVLQTIGRQKGVDIESMPIPEFLLHMKDYGLPSIESVGRARRKIQCEHPRLRAVADVEAGRMLEEEKYKRFARS